MPTRTAERRRACRRDPRRRKLLCAETPALFAFALAPACPRRYSSRKGPL